MDAQSLMDWLASGAGTITLAVLSGAGGSALLELLWKPRRDRRRVAGTLLGEILANTEVAVIWSHVRQQKPRAIPSDLQFSALGWQAVASMVSELPPDLTKSVLLLYRRYEHLNFCIQDYVKTVDELDALDSASPRAEKLKRHINSIIDVFNTSVDTVYKHGLDLAALLLPIAGIKEERTASPSRDYSKDVQKLLSDRARRLDFLNRPTSN